MGRQGNPWPSVILALLIGLLGELPAAAADDPWEPFNRPVAAFNGYLVRNLIEPVATATEQAVPDLLRQASVNLYANLTEPEFIVTNLMAGHLKDAGKAAGRFVVNSTLGLAGVLDPATALGLTRRQTEFGEAMCALGVPTDPYLVLPLVGPTNAWSAGLLTGFIVGGWYGLNLISPLLATADLILDLSASAASLRHATEAPDHSSPDPYLAQRGEYHRYVAQACSSPRV